MKTVVRYSNILSMVINSGVNNKMNDDTKRELFEIYYNYLLGNIKSDDIDLKNKPNLSKYVEKDNPKVLIKK